MFILISIRHKIDSRKGKPFFVVEGQLTNVDRLTEKYHIAAILVINNSDKIHHCLNTR